MSGLGRTSSLGLAPGATAVSLIGPTRWRFNLDLSAPISRGMARAEKQWKGERLYLGSRLSGYSIVPDKHYPQMWRIRRPDGSLSDIVNRTRS
jgi:hypothetical protein